MSVPAAATRTAENVGRGILILVAAMFVFACQDGITKHLAPRFASPQIIWIRFVAFVLLGLWLVCRKGVRRAFYTGAPWLQLAWGIVLVTQMLGFVLVLRYLPLADAHVIMASTPLIVTVLAIPLLGESVDLRRWLAVLAGFAGVLVILRPGLGAMQAGSGFALGVAFMYAMFIPLTRMVSRVDSAGTTLVWTGAVGLVSMTLTAPFVWIWPDLEGWLFLGALALFSAANHWLLIKALERAPASVLQPYSYSILVWAILIGWLVFGDFPDLLTIVGAAVIVASGLYTYGISVVSMRGH